MSFGGKGALAWTAAIYGEAAPSTVNSLRSQFDGAMNTLTEYGKKFFERSKETFEFFNGTDAIRYARSVAEKVGLVGETDHIIFLGTVADFQKARPQMQRFIMANPTWRERYQKQLCDGYSQTYHDESPAAIGEAHRDWRLATEGILKFEDDGRWVAYEYFDDLGDNERRLIHEEQDAIMRTWKYADYLAATDDDITSPSGGKL